MKQLHLITVVLLALLLPHMQAGAQINAEQVTRIGQNALYFEDYLLSIQCFNQAIQAKPYLAKPYYLRSVAKFNLEDYTGAEADATEAIQRNPFMTNAYEVRGIARQALGRPGEAAADYRRALELLPYNRALMFNEAIALEEDGKLDDASSAYARLLGDFPGFANGYLGRAKLLMSRGDTIAAGADLDRAIELDRNLPGAYMLKGEIAANQGNDTTALAAFDNAARLLPKNAGIYVNRAFVRYRLLDYRGALKDYEEAIVLEPLEKVAYFNRGLLRMEALDLDRALQDFNEVLKLDPDDYRAYYNRAMIYQQKKEYTRALRDITRVVDAYPDFAGALFARFSIYDEMGDRRNAMRDYDRAIDLWKQLREDYAAHENTAPDDDLAGDPSNGNSNGSGGSGGNGSGGSNGGNKDDDSQQFKSDTRREVTRRFMSLLQASNDIDIDQEYNNTEIRGRLQDRDPQASPEPLLYLSYYPSNQVIEQGQAFSMKEVTDLNRANALRNKLWLTQSEGPDGLNTTFDDHRRQVDYYNTVLATGHARAIDFFGRAMERLYLHDYEGAERDLNDAIAISPDFTLAYFMRSTARQRNWLLAQEHQQPDEPGHNPAGTDAIIARSRLESTRQGAIDDLYKVITLSPRNAAAYYNLGCMLAQSGDEAAAIDCFTHAIDIEPSMAAAYFNRGYLHLKNGDSQQGTQDLSRAGSLGLARSYSVIKRMNKY